MLEFKNGFECTDDDCMQCRKYIGDRKYMFIQALWLDTINDEETYMLNIELHILMEYGFIKEFQMVK